MANRAGFSSQSILFFGCCLRLTITTLAKAIRDRSFRWTGIARAQFVWDNPKRHTLADFFNSMSDQRGYIAHYRNARHFYRREADFSEHGGNCGGEIERQMPGETRFRLAFQRRKQLPRCPQASCRKAISRNAWALGSTCLCMG